MMPTNSDVSAKNVSRTRSCSYKLSKIDAKTYFSQQELAVVDIKLAITVPTHLPQVSHRDANRGL